MFNFTVRADNPTSPFGIAGPFCVRAWSPWGAVREVKRHWPQHVTDHVCRMSHVLTVYWRRRLVLTSDRRGETVKR